MYSSTRRSDVCRHVLLVFVGKKSPDIFQKTLDFIINFETCSLLFSNTNAC